VISELIRPLGGRDVYGHHDEVGGIVEVERHDVLVLEGRLVIGRQIPRERRESEWREERVLDRTESGIRRFEQGRQDELDLHRPFPRSERRGWTVAIPGTRHGRAGVTRPG
jgi:hypothetical protein